MWGKAHELISQSVSSCVNIRIDWFHINIHVETNTDINHRMWHLKPHSNFNMK